jgi:hypothetical protein
MPRVPIAPWRAVWEGDGNSNAAKARICYPSCAVTCLSRKRTCKFDRLRSLRSWQPLDAGGPHSTSTVITRHARLANKNEIKKFILSRILVTRQVINGFAGLMNGFIGQSPGGSTNTYNTSKGYWNNNTQSLQHFHS